jgi:spore coat polysaccharide biosynthesis protein SpsF (cytidylyltransferase family)
MSNFDVFIPVRLSNTRLPNKALKLVDGKPIILYLIERVKKSKKIRNVIVCTTTNESESPLVSLLEKNNISVFRGDEKDILNRYLEASKKFDTDFIISVDGDDVYTDPSYIDEIVSIFEKDNPDYVDMVNFPFGIASVGIKVSALEKICKIKTTDNTETGYRLFFTENNIFNIFELKFSDDLQYPKNLRLTLDYEEDLVLAKKILDMLGNDFHLSDILKLFENSPDLLKITENLEKKYKEHWDGNVADTSIRDI